MECLKFGLSVHLNFLKKFDVHGPNLITSTLMYPQAFKFYVHGPNLITSTLICPTPHLTHLEPRLLTLTILEITFILIFCPQKNLYSSLS